MKKILFPTDFSETANNAFKYSLHLAQSLQADLYILHNFEMPVISTLNSGKPEEVKNAYTTIELQHFDKFKEQTPLMHKIAEEQNASDVNLVFLFKEGDLLDNIKLTINEESIDWIVMGTSGESGFDKKLFGSNTMNIIKSIDIPVLSIPHLAVFNEISNIGFTTRFKESDRKPLADVIKIADHFKASLKCFHVTRDTEDPTIELAIRDWKRSFEDYQLDFIIQKQEFIDLDEHVTAFIKEYKIDLLTIVKRNQGFFDKLFSTSLSKKIASKAKTPILIIKEQK